MGNLDRIDIDRYGMKSWAVITTSKLDDLYTARFLAKKGFNIVYIEDERSVEKIGHLDSAINEPGQERVKTKHISFNFNEKFTATDLERIWKDNGLDELDISVFLNHATVYPGQSTFEKIQEE